MLSLSTCCGLSPVHVTLTKPCSTRAVAAGKYYSSFANENLIFSLSVLLADTSCDREMYLTLIALKATAMTSGADFVEIMCLEGFHICLKRKEKC